MLSAVSGCCCCLDRFLHLDSPCGQQHCGRPVRGILTRRLAVAGCSYLTNFLLNKNSFGSLVARSVFDVMLWPKISHSKAPHGTGNVLLYVISPSNSEWGKAKRQKLLQECRLSVGRSVSGTFHPPPPLTSLTNKCCSHRSTVRYLGIFWSSVWVTGLYRYVLPFNRSGFGGLFSFDVWMVTWCLTKFGLRDVDDAVDDGLKGCLF